MNHFPETTAALRRLARAIKESVSLFIEARELRRIRHHIEAENKKRLEAQMRDVMYEHNPLARMLAEQQRGGIDRTSSPWWRVKDYEEAETGEK